MPQQSSYTPIAPDKRQPLIAEQHAEQDTMNIEAGLDWLDGTDARRPYTVLDIGCEYGAGTQQRFGGDGRFTVTGVAEERTEIEYAKEHHDAPNTTYRTVEYDTFDAFSSESFDIVFTAGLFQHVDDPDTLLNTVWNLVADPGLLLVREFEDAQHIHYPDEEELTAALTATGPEPYASSRQYGRKVYTRMSRSLDPEPAKLDLNIESYHTAGTSREERERYWNVYHADRIRSAINRAERDDASDAARELADYLQRVMARMEEKFLTQETFLDAITVPLATACKQSDADSEDSQ